MRSIRILLKLSFFIAPLLALPALAYDKGSLTLPDSPESPVLSIEIAKTREDKERGLMFRKTIEPYHGMLFDMGIEHPSPSMWMKNTEIPLDMVFYNGKREAVFTHKDAKPHSLQSVTSPASARYVLELPSGGIQKYGIKKGHRFELTVAKPEDKEE